MITFDAPLLLYVAPAVAILIVALGLWARRARVRHAGRWSLDLAQLARRTGHRGWIALGGAALLGAVALSGPRSGRRVVSAESKALNLVLAVDVSRSMLAEDAKPSRLVRAQREARRLIHDLASDRIGLIAFAGQSFIMAPLTVDGSALQLLVDGLDPDISSSGGTALARALRQGGDLLLGGTDVADRVLVMFTDAEAHDSIPEILAAGEQLEREGVRLILVAEGGREPVPIPVRNTDGSVAGMQLDADGRQIQTFRRDYVLTALADAARGVVVPAELNDQAGAVRELVLSYKRSPQATAVTSSGVLRAWLPLLAAALILLGHTVTRRTAALAALLIALGAPAVARAQGLPHPGDELWRHGNVRGAAERYVADVQRGRGGDTAWLAAGTAGLAVGDTLLARTALTHAAESVDPEVRFRALYNLGLLELRLAARDSAARDRLLGEARRRYREALFLKPNDPAAKWNLEIAIRRTPPQSGGGEAPQGGGGGASQPEERPRPSGLSPSQAEQILNSIAEEERATRRALRRRMSQMREPRGEKDW